MTVLVHSFVFGGVAFGELGLRVLSRWWFMLQLQGIDHCSGIFLFSSSFLIVCFRRVQMVQPTSIVRDDIAFLFGVLVSDLLIGLPISDGILDVPIRSFEVNQVQPIINHVSR